MAKFITLRKATREDIRINIDDVSTLTETNGYGYTVYRLRMKSGDIISLDYGSWLLLCRLLDLN